MTEVTKKFDRKKTCLGCNPKPLNREDAYQKALD